MIRLIKNEMYKILHKKSTYVVLIITILLMFLVSFIYKSDLLNINNYYNAYEEDLYASDNFDSELERKAYNDALNDTKNKLNKYTKDDWQYYVVYEKYFDISKNYYDSLYIHKELLNEAKDLYEKTNESLENDNWKYFVNEDIKNVKDELNTINDTIKNGNLSEEEKNNYNVLVYSKNVELEMLNYRLKENVSYGNFLGNDYLNNAIYMVNSLSSSVANYNLAKTTKEKKNYEDDVKKFYEYKYTLETKEDTNNTQDLRFIVMNFFDEYLFLILVFSIMISGAIVSDEYSKGTIKSLLVTPYKRSSIILAKFITVIIMTILFIFTSFLAQILIGGILLGFSSLKINVAIYNIASQKMVIMNCFKYFLINLGTYLPQIILLSTLAFMASTVLGSTAFAIAITFCGYIGSSIINGIALSFPKKIFNYFVTTCWNFNDYLFGGTSIYNVSLKHSIIVCLIYFILMIIIIFEVFKRKNIKNI